MFVSKKKHQEAIRRHESERADLRARVRQLSSQVDSLKADLARLPGRDASGRFQKRS